MRETCGRIFFHQRNEAGFSHSHICTLYPAHPGYCKREETEMKVTASRIKAAVQLRGLVTQPAGLWYDLAVLQQMVNRLQAAIDWTRGAEKSEKEF